MTVSTARVSISDPKYIRQQLKAKKITPQIVMSLAGYTEVGASSFNTMLRQGSITSKVAEVFYKLGISFHE